MKCCTSDGNKEMNEMMSSCMQKFKLCPCCLVGIAIVLLLLGYFLSAATIKTLWLIGAALMLLLGLGCLVKRKKK